MYGMSAYSYTAMNRAVKTIISSSLATRLSWLLGQCNIAPLEILHSVTLLRQFNLITLALMSRKYQLRITSQFLKIEFSPTISWGSSWIRFEVRNKFCFRTHRPVLGE